LDGGVGRHPHLDALAGIAGRQHGQKVLHGGSLILDRRWLARRGRGVDAIEGG
jgi:hypothetical protein